MKLKLCLGLCLLGLLGGPGRLWAQITSVQSVQTSTTFNLLSTGGQPISTVAGVPPGSNGKDSSTNSSAGSFNLPTTNQFLSFVSFGAVAAPTNYALFNTNSVAYLKGTNAFSGAVAVQMGLPVGYSNNVANGVVILVQQQLQIGAPYLSSPVSYAFGSIIAPPATDVNGNVLTNNATAYWQAAPYNPGGASSQYYASPNAGVVFATQPGQVQITWITTGSYADVSSLGYANPGGAAFPNFLTNGANIYLLYTATYIVSGVPVKPTQKMYWTEGSFAGTGYPVNVANGVVSTVHVVYNSSFPTNVTTPYQDPDVVPITNPTNTLQEFRTLWFDPTENQIRAYNAVGRVFIELLGAPVNSGTSKTYLGFEIVDVAQAPSAQVLTNNLGDQMSPYADGFENQNVTPFPIQNTLGSQYYYQYTYGGVTTLYADQLTDTPTDMQCYWLSTGVAGLQWPDLFDDYNLVWPADPSLYSHYIRPLVATQAQAAQTAVQLDGNEDPSLDYQDPLDQPRGFLTATNTFYTWLTPGEPAHRALLRFNAGNNIRFERVFSYLSTALQNPAQLAGSVATNLSAWNPTNSTLTNYASTYNPPYATNETAYVGQAITDPPGEIGSTNWTYGDYWAGYINQSMGTSFDPYTYFDPFANGFTGANAGSIIPVNAIPGSNTLEVLWFRQNTANATLGFQPVYWPSIIADYTIKWPQNAPQIVMAGNAGSGPLDGEQAAGAVYYQNDPTQPGYNPNEEHAVMLGGQAYALRDDLNVTTTNNASLPFGGYSSAPFVLDQYTGDDGRPAMVAFQVLQENPAAGVFFDYVVPAGTMLQAPMPLPLMAPPIALNTNYPNGYTNYNTAPLANAGDLPAGWNANSPSSPYGLYGHFTFEDRNNNFWVYRGLNAGLPPLQAGYYNLANNTFTNLPAARAVLNSNFVSFIHLSRLLPSLTVGASNLPPGLTLVESVTNGLSVQGTPTTTGTYPALITVADTDGSSVSAPLTITVAASGLVTNLGPLVIVSTNQYTGSVDTYSNRPPSLASAPATTNCFTMRFYYKTLAGFAWPGLGNATNWPAVGTIVPYLRPFKNGAYSGGDGTSTNTTALDIVYRPVWPGLGADGQSPLPHLDVGQTLTTAINGLAAVRGQDSVQVIYQQSIATNAVLTNTASSVVLYDPTVEKKSSLANLNGLPAGVLADAYQGLSYFPNLPPNLISRVWFDPNGTNLVLAGQYVHDVVNGDYVMLNVLRGDDLAAVDALCPGSSPNYAAWTNDVAGLTVSEYTEFMDPFVPGLYDINPNLTVIRGAGDLVVVTNSDTAVDSYALSAAGPGQGYISYVVANGLNPKYAGDPVVIYIARVGQPLFPGNLVVVNSANASPFSQLITFQHTADLGGNTSQYLFDWRIEPPVNGVQPQTSETNWTQLFQANPGPVYTLGATGIQGLGDNYVSMRYGQLQTNNSVVTTNWSAFANPILAQGWIKRVTENIDPVAGQTQNLYNNPASTTASLIALAGSRWIGNVPLNAATLTNNGLIQIYETVLNVGKSLSINAGINYGPANQALLLAAGYLNDLYTTLGNDAWANSLNPTIGIGTDNQTYGSIATSQFVFEGEEPTLLEQNLALLRGRDDSLSPGVDVPPVYNHLFWNYTYGLDAGQVMYALNYNITDQNGDGVVNAADAAIMYPQGHGDAYGHYLTALMNYYELLMNPNFDWVPQSEAVSVLGATVQVNYQDEQKFAASAAALARTGRQVFDLTWREDYTPGTAGGWNYFSSNHVGQYTYVDNNGNTQDITRSWGMDHWAARTGQGAYLNWVVGNAILPPKDTNPNDQGVQIVDRTTVSDLQELPATEAALQNDLDNANAGFTPLGLAQNAIPFDINPQQVTGANPQTHFEQVYGRAVQALNNAVVAFNAAQNVTADLRQQQNSLSDLKAAVTAQELAYNDQLIELYGTPYPDDVGPGQTYPQGYTGPDLIHYMYVDGQATNTFGGILPDPFASSTFNVSITALPAGWSSGVYSNFDFIQQDMEVNNQNTNAIVFNVGPDGFSKPAAWTDERGSVGSIQTAALAANAAQDACRTAVWQAQQDYLSLNHAIATFNAETVQQNTLIANTALINTLGMLNSTLQSGLQKTTAFLNDQVANINEDVNSSEVDIPTTIIAGTADGGDEAKAALAPVVATGLITANSLQAAKYVAMAVVYAAIAGDLYEIHTLTTQDSALNLAINQQNAINAIVAQLTSMQNDLNTINQDQTALAGAQGNYQTLLSQGNRLQAERLTFRQHTAAQVQGDTVANAAFLVFQNEDLERYNTLFNLAAEYSWMAANAYDYETGLLGTPAGQAYLNQIISSCALGVVQNGQPQISGTTTGDPGLANAMAEMYADFETLKGRLGFNNPDGYGTTVSLRQENYRINSDSTGDNNWQQVLEQGLMPDLLADPDVKNNCLQIDNGSGAAVPGLELTFSTTITPGENLFGRPLSGADHAYSSSSFATKIFALGVDLDGYVGMDNPVSNSGASGNSPTEPTLDPNVLAATPYVYLIPCGADSMRSPPLGDTSTVRTWNVDDVAIPLPFNIGASAFSDAPFYQSADSLSEPLFAVRRQQAFRPVSSLDAFNTSIYGAAGSLAPSQYTNRRLIGRSVWNSKWKLIIPGGTLLADPNQGLTRFINSVKDVHLYFVTYSYSGN